MNGGFNLHKFLSNKCEVIEAIPKEQRAKEVKDFDTTKDILLVERALGIQWCVQSDHLQFRVEQADRPLTRHGILLTISSIYDPLGLVAPFVLQGKHILQAICQDGAHWDDLIPDHLRTPGVKWREKLGCLAKLKVPRCYKPNDFGKVKTIKLHNFSNGSTYRYSQCWYLRMTNSQGRIHCAFVMAKLRVILSKPITVPTLELTAALMSVKVNAFFQRKLRYGVTPEVFWTDREVVLGYISNDAQRFHTFVANRVQSIREYATPDQWRNVHTKENPADEASRGLNAQELLSHSWWNGPSMSRLVVRNRLRCQIATQK